ncbi:MAG: GGDEF domain-containing protein [Thermodesulfobacteriota bacterium]
MSNPDTTHKVSRLNRAIVKLSSPLQLRPEERHRRIPAVFILIGCIITMMIFTPYHFFAGHFLITAADIVALIAAVSTLLHLRKAQQGGMAYWMISLVFIAICISTVVLGRQEISYFLWTFVPPAVFFSILGKRAGMNASLLFFALTVILMAAPQSIMGTPPYTLPVIGRYITIYLLLTFMLYYYEASQLLLLRHIREEKEKFECASKQDPLTGLSNRRDLIEKIREEQQRQMRLKNTFTLILGDIDNFKAVNDAHGHDAGDFVLQSVAQLLKDQVRNIDCPARWGGEEFLIMLIETDLEGGLAVAERIRNRLEETGYTFNGVDIPPVTMTFGLSQYQGASDTLDSCIKRADKALYTGKSRGKNTVVTA